MAAPKPKAQNGEEDPAEDPNANQTVIEQTNEKPFYPDDDGPGPSGYYEYQPTYWKNPTYDSFVGQTPEAKRSVSSKPMYSERQDVWIKGGYFNLDDDQKKLVVDASNSLGEYEVPASWYDGTLRSALNISTTSNGAVTVEQALQAMVDPEVLAKINSGEGRGGGGGRTITAPDDTQIRRVMDQTSMGLIGRTLSDKEFDKYYKEYKSEYLGAQGNIDTAQVLTERVRKEEDYQEMSVAKKFGAAMNNVLKGSL